MSNQAPTSSFSRDVFDRLAGIAGLVVFSPVLIAAIAAVVIEDGFPAFYKQQRVGRGGRPFALWKLRSMRSSNAGPQITAGGDPRITRVGRIIRKYKIDELPQFWNLIVGDLSLVGPRPEVARYVEMVNPVWQRVLAVRPGITDLATLVYRNEEELLAAAADPERAYREQILPAKLQLNIEYLENRNWWTDIKLIAMTTRYSFFPGGFDGDKIRQGLLEQNS
jgi:lipopolysaccharide/colanic/teichoic acid biosynthesis glycosyltransferase